MVQGVCGLWGGDLAAGSEPNGQAAKITDDPNEGGNDEEGQDGCGGEAEGEGDGHGDEGLGLSGSFEQ